MKVSFCILIFLAAALKLLAATKFIAYVDSTAKLFLLIQVHEGANRECKDDGIKVLVFDYSAGLEKF